MSLPDTRELEIISLNISLKKGTIKSPVPTFTISEQGVEGDAHSGPWNRQVSLLGMESIEKFSSGSGRSFMPGEFAENITTRGMELFRASPLDVILGKDIILEITQIGKKCHGDYCAIYKEVGQCVMPKEGIFCRVIKGGQLFPGDKLVVQPKTYKTLVITLSDRASRGAYEDKSGPALSEMMEEYCRQKAWNLSIENKVIPDEPGLLRDLLTEAGQNGLDFVFTTGGTGIGPRDITPEVVRPLLDKEISGIMDHIRLKFGQQTPNALLTRS
ncbi:MAG: molybdopterin-binding protein, partial [Bacteroidetes bacterium]|nr:molybdopterin-binding protein [Bacteroidota bacterium]